MQTLVFGGAFDPPHNEHVEIARQAVKKIKPELLLVVPTFLPPHKQAGFIDFDDRQKMCEKAFTNMGVRTVVSDIEKQRGKVNYAWEVLCELKKDYGDLFYLIGSDSLLTFDTWQNPQKIADAATLVVAIRGGDDITNKVVEVTKKYNAKIIVLDQSTLNVSSTENKTKLLLGLETSDIPTEVVNYIKNHNLFFDYNKIIEGLKQRQTADLFEHTAATVLRAIDMNKVLNLKLDYEKVFLAALLHDSAKQLKHDVSYQVPADCINTPVMHQFLGEIVAKEEFGITDREVLSAIKCHTTAKKDMTSLEKLIYMADMLSYDRYSESDWVEPLANEVYKDFEKGFVMCLNKSYFHIKSKNKGMYPLTEEAYKYYNNLEE